MRKTIISACFLFCVTLPVFSQSDSTETVFRSKEFNWKIVIPKGYSPIGTEEWGKIQKRGEDAMEKANKVEIENRVVSIFVYRFNLMHYMEANWQSYEEQELKDYTALRKFVGNAVYNTMRQQVGNAKIDTTYSNEKIDGLKFDVFSLKIELPGSRNMNMIMYTRLFGRKEFSFNCIAVEEDKLKDILQAFRKSSFHE